MHAYQFWQFDVANFVLFSLLYLVAANMSKIPIMIACFNNETAYPVFPWQNLIDAMPSKTPPFALLYHLITAMMLAFHSAGFFFREKSSYNRRIEQMVLHCLFGVFIIQFWVNLGTKPLMTAFFFNIPPYVVMTVSLIQSNIREAEPNKPHPWYRRYSDFIYFVALMSAAYFEGGYRLWSLFVY
jgi:hypothetical protein